MTILSILIALLLERIAPQLVELRQYRWLREYNQWMNDVLHIERLGAWLGFVILIFPLLLVIWILSAMFENTLFGLFELAFNVAIVFLCLGPRELDSQIESYLDAIEVGDSQQQFRAAGLLIRETPEIELSNQVKQVSRSVFIEANSRIFAVLFWFTLLGPLAAVLYRLLEQLLQQKVVQELSDELDQVIQSILGWIDWLPVHLTLFAYMLSGNFEEGMKSFKNGSVSAINVYEQNNDLLQNVGFEAITANEVVNPGLAIEMVRKSRGLVLRSLVVWLLLLLVLSLLG
jgi:membrane protein required for beta-lactamase induction